jgi:hypothetical protein
MYSIAIPTYNRHNVIFKKTLTTLIHGGVDPDCIFLFVADYDELERYETSLPRQSYNQIIVGEKGIANQRKFITNYFREGKYVISIDDDIDEYQILRDDKLVKITNIHEFFIDAYHVLEHERLHIWGIYPVRNSFFMREKYTTDLRFIIGVTFGYIVRHDKRLEPSILSETKEDYEQTILYFKKDGGVLRFNNITAKTKFNAPGGLGTDRYERNKNASEYLVKTYPDIVKRRDRKDGTPEVRLSIIPRKKY